MQWHDLYISFVGFLSEFLGTLSGFGSSTFFVPLALFFEKYQFVLALTATLHIFGNFSKIFLFRSHINKPMLLQYFLPVVLLTGVGAFLNRYIDFEYLKKGLGVFIIFLAVIFYFKSAIVKNLSKSYAFPLLGLSGFLTGLLGTGGALRGLALTTLQIEKNSFVALSSTIDIGGDLLRAAVYFYHGYFDWSHWYYLPLLLLAAYLGALAGKKILNKLSHEQFEKMVIFFVVLSGISLFF